MPATQPPEESSFRRKISKREKRNMKKENKLRKLKSSGMNDAEDSNNSTSNNKSGSVAEKLYTGTTRIHYTLTVCFSFHLKFVI